MSNTATVVNQSATSATNASVVLNDLINSGIEVTVSTTDTAAQNTAQTKEVGTVVLLQKLITERKAW